MMNYLSVQHQNYSIRIDRILIVAILTLGQGCLEKSGQQDTPAHASELIAPEGLTSPITPVATPDKQVLFEVTEDKLSMNAYYELDHIKEWYPERILPPPFDYDVDISNKTIVELWLLRNEIFARNGYLFEDAVLRGHFNKFKWYQPIFDVEDFKVELNSQEESFVEKILARENILLKERYVKQGNGYMINADHVYNQFQFKQIPDNLRSKLAQKNFVLVQAEHEQFFHVYDRNHYDYIPNFITTDIYLQVLHKHFSALLQRIEEHKFIPLLTGLLKHCYVQSLKAEKGAQDIKLKKASQWATTYLAIAYSLITESVHPVSPEMNSLYKEEMAKVNKAEGSKSAFLDANLFLYAQFKPRGNYTKTKQLENYFRCMKWLNSAPIFLEDDQRFLSGVLIAGFIKDYPERLRSFQAFNGAIQFIVGEEDNLSMANLIRILSYEDIRNPDRFDVEKINVLRKRLYDLEVDQIKPAGADEGLSRKRILFSAGRYTFDAEMLIRLVHVKLPEPKRPFPKGLDVFATLGNREAENILMNEYHEPSSWEAYPDSLRNLQRKFAGFQAWDKNIYSKIFETIGSLSAENPNEPLFMQTASWDRKNLITSLAAWTELKHDMLLYSEQPFAAQAGEGGGPPPPVHISYVEPNLAFWKKGIELLNFQEQNLSDMGLMDDYSKRILIDLKEIANFLLTVSEKELAKEKISIDEFNQLSWLGGRIEYLTFRIFGSDHLPEKERLVALIADVYNNNGTFLEEAVGPVDEIYVIAEINGKPYLTKGAVFSYYEFTSKTPLTDEEWQASLLSGRRPARPPWMSDIIIDSQSLESKPGYSF